MDTEGIKLARIECALDGDSLMTLNEIYAELIDYLRSDATLSKSLRVSLADAIQRGQDEADGVRLRIEAKGRHFKNAIKCASNRRLIEAGAYIQGELKKGRKPTEIDRELRDIFVKEDGTDYGRRARKFFSQFCEYVVSKDPTLKPADAFWLGYPPKPDFSQAEDEWAFFASHYSDLRSWGGLETVPRK